MIKDSGARREFETGAVRDVAAGKGRCDLLPLMQVGEWSCDSILTMLGKYIKTKDTIHIYRAMSLFIYKRGWDKPTAILEVSKHYEEGCIKYAPRNWEKGIPIHCFIDSATRHYLKWVRGDEDEPHDRAFLWNCLGLLWTLENKPECMDL